MLTGMTEPDWKLVVEVFRAARSRRGDRGRDDRRFLEALHYFTVHNITWRALPKEFGPWNSVWKRFWRLSRAGVFETFFQLLIWLGERWRLARLFLRSNLWPRGRGFQELSFCLAFETRPTQPLLSWTWVSLRAREQFASPSLVFDMRAYAG